MKTELRFIDLSFRLIQILVWFEILWAVVFLTGMVFEWTGLTEQLATAFYGSGLCALLVLIALTLLNVTANMNIISIAQVQKTLQGDISERKRGTWYATLAIAGGLIAMVVLSLWISEWRLYKAKASEAEAKIESIADTRLIGEAMDLIDANGKVGELERIRDALSVSIQSGARLSFLIPRVVKDVTIYYELTAWWYGTKIDETKVWDTSLNKFVVGSSERNLWNQLIAGKISSFVVPSGRELRAFRRVKNNKGELVLLLDTSRRSEYTRGSF
jgi:hypothetical protein